MNNTVSIAMSSGKALYDATDETEWNVTFLTNEVKRGRIVPVDAGVFALVNARQPAQAVAVLARVSEANAETKAEALFNQAEALRRSNRAAESGVAVDRLLKQYARVFAYSFWYIPIFVPGHDFSLGQRSLNVGKTEDKSELPSLLFVKPGSMVIGWL